MATVTLRLLFVLVILAHDRRRIVHVAVTDHPTSGWMAQWQEMVDDSEQKIARPRQLYTGGGPRDYVPMDQR